jgi:hypothetical protein
MSAGRKPAAPTSEDVLSVEHMDDAALHREDREDGASATTCFPVARSTAPTAPQLA